LDNVANIVTEVGCNSSTNMPYLISESIGQIKQYACMYVCPREGLALMWDRIEPDTSALATFEI